jgi:hypothetical protein
MILLIEPHWETCRAIERLLSFHGYAVRSMSTMGEGLDACRHERPRVILANQCASDVPLESFREMIDQNPTLHGIGLISYEAHEPSPEADATLNFGARDWLHRAGVRWSDLLPQIEDHFAHTGSGATNDSFVTG